jgi:2-methylcitrate dehydratase PrpD
MDSVFQAAVRFIGSARYEGLPASIVNKAKICMLDTFAAAVLGRQCQATQVAKTTALAALSGVAPDATIWFEPHQQPVACAIFINATAASAADIDDGLDLNRGHAGSTIIPAVLAVCESNRCSLKKALAAVAVGYELMFVVSEALLPYGGEGYPIDHGSGSLGAVAVAAALSNLLGEEERCIAESLRVSQAYMPGGNNDRAVESGAMTKENINWGALTGYFAFRLAQNGYTGQTSVLEKLPWSGNLLQHLSPDFSALERTYIKRYASCRFTHWPIEALLKLQTREHFHIEQVDRVTVYTFRSGTMLKLTEAPGVEGIQYSIPLCLAIVAKYGELNKPEKLMQWACDPEVRRLSERVSLKWDRRFERKGDEGEGCKVEIRLKNGSRHTAVCSSLLGDRRQPFGFNEVAKKFLDNCSGYLDHARILELIDCVQDVENQSIERLLSLVRRD